MEFIILLFVFVFGAIIGSFLNVVILRYNTGRSIVSGRSICFSCGDKLCWYNLLPIVSFTLQKGRCSRCLSKISWQYPSVEILTAISMTYLYSIFGPSVGFVFYSIILSLLVVISVYDLRHQIIPEGPVYLLIVIGAIKLIFIYLYSSNDIAISSMFDGIVLFLFLGSFWIFSDGVWMGFGDAKLVLGLGLFFPLCLGVTALTYAFWIGAVVGVLINLLHKKIREIPFAPFIIMGFIIVFVFHSNLFSYLGSLCIK